MKTTHQLMALALVVGAATTGLRAQISAPPDPDLEALRSDIAIAETKYAAAANAVNASAMRSAPEPTKTQPAEDLTNARYGLALAEANWVANTMSSEALADLALDYRASMAGPAAMDDSTASFRPAFQLRAAKDDSDASLRWGTSLDEFRFISFTASVPAQSGDTPLATLDGLAGASTLEVKYNWYWGKGPAKKPQVAPGQSSHNSRAEYLTRRIHKLRPASPSAARTGSLEADQDPVIRKIREKTEQVADRTVLFSASGTIGYKNFEYLDELSLADQSTKKTVYGGRLSSAWYFDAKRAVLLSFEYQDTFESADEESFALPPGTNGFAEVKNGPVGAPSHTLKRLYSAEFLQRVTIGKNENCGFAVRVTYDQVEDVLGVRVPFYFIQNDAGTTTGGIELGWTDHKDNAKAKFTVGVIIGAGLTITPF